MFYRRKIILALLQLFDGRLEKIRLQKLLFLFSQKQEKRVYDFIPYRFGSYSYSANADMTAMVSRGFLSAEEKHFTKTDTTNYLNQLRPVDLKLLHEVKTNYGNMNATALMKHTYTNFPFYAINSEVAESILNRSDLEIVNACKPKSDKTILFTIGDQGISLEEYLVRLIKNDVKILVDVRNNPQSMKYGFSKTRLKSYCASLGIEYIHIPEVGIHTGQRQELHTQNDYDKLFANYRKDDLSKTTSHQTKILELLKKHKRIALTCFEANICQCHRKPLAESISSFSGIKYEVKHI